MLHNDAVRLAKISVEKFQKVAFIPSHILPDRSHMSTTGWWACHCDVIAGECVGLHNGWCLEMMEFVDCLLCCIQNTQNCVAKALVSQSLMGQRRPSSHRMKSQNSCSWGGWRGGGVEGTCWGIHIIMQSSFGNTVNYIHDHKQLGITLVSIDSYMHCIFAFSDHSAFDICSTKILLHNYK